MLLSLCNPASNVAILNKPLIDFIVIYCFACWKKVKVFIQYISDYGCLVFVKIVGLLVTALLIETIGRRYTMALEFFLFACFVVLTNFCVKR